MLEGENDMKPCNGEGCTRKGTISQVTLFEEDSTRENGIGERWYCKKCYDKLGNTYNESLLHESEEKRVI